jgi:hypothetical protein
MTQPISSRRRQSIGGRPLKQCLSILLAGLKLYPCAPLFANGPSEQERQAAQVKAAILKLGVGNDARVAVILQDNNSGSGYVAQAGEDSFLLSDFCTDAAVRISCNEVRGVRGVNVATGARASAGKRIPRRETAALEARDPCAGASIIVAGDRGFGQKWKSLMPGLILGSFFVVLAIVLVSDRNF